MFNHLADISHIKERVNKDEIMQELKDLCHRYEDPTQQKQIDSNKNTLSEFYSKLSLVFEKLDEEEDFDCTETQEFKLA